MQNFVKQIKAASLFMYKTEDIYKDITEAVKTRFNTSHFELGRPLPKEKNRKVIGLRKDQLSGKIMKEFVGLRAKIVMKTTIMKTKMQKAQKSCHENRTQFSRL